MGVKERHEREREAMTRTILDAARELFVAEGYHNVTIRKLAERIEYSPAAIYSYFPSKDDIFLALAEEGFRILFNAAHCQRTAVSRIDAIRSMFWCIYEFSKSHPEYYALMFVDRTVPLISQDWQRFGFVREMKANVAAFIQQAIDAGDFPPDTDPNTVFHCLMAPIQGIAIANLCQRLVPGESADTIARDVLEAALTGLRTGFPRTSNHPVCCE